MYGLVLRLNVLSFNCIERYVDNQWASGLVMV